MNGHTIIKCLLSAALLAGCGASSDPYGDSEPSPADPAFDAVKPLVDAECGRCHNGSTHPLRFVSGTVFKNSKAAVRIKNGSMPPDRQLDPGTKQKLLTYLEG